jgi:hypothetical protein
MLCCVKGPLIILNNHYKKRKNWPTADSNVISSEKFATSLEVETTRSSAAANYSVQITAPFNLLVEDQQVSFFLTT